MTTPHDKALEAFTEFFVRNYPGPDTVIFDPKWHAPKLFNAAMKAIEAAGGIVCAREPSAWAHRLNLELDQFITELTGEPEHPFGEPGEDYSSEYTVTSTPLHIPIEAGNGGDGWNRDMDAAPKDKSPVIIAVLHKDNDAYIIGEAYFDPEHYGNGDWWWAGNSYEDYHGGPISEINYHGPSAWRHLPPPPSPSNEGEKP